MCLSHFKNKQKILCQRKELFCCNRIQRHEKLIRQRLSLSQKNVHPFYGILRRHCNLFRADGHFLYTKQSITLVTYHILVVAGLNTIYVMFVKYQFSYSQEIVEGATNCGLKFTMSYQIFSQTLSYCTRTCFSMNVSCLMLLCI